MFAIEEDAHVEHIAEDLRKGTGAATASERFGGASSTYSDHKGLEEFFGKPTGVPPSGINRGQ